jgi:hypothetical protein
VRDAGDVLGETGREPEFWASYPKTKTSNPKGVAFDVFEKLSTAVQIADVVAISNRSMRTHAVLLLIQLREDLQVCRMD